MLRSEIIGQVNMKSCLSGMPTLKLGLNDKIFFEISGRSNLILTPQLLDHEPLKWMILNSINVLI
jgi:AP-1 complex subunit mu